MLLKYFYDRALAQASYFVGCQQTGEAVLIDPMRDISPYLAAAAEEGMTIVAITETHIHADFVSGARELAACTGAPLYLSGEGGPDWSYTFLDPGRGDRALYDGDHFMVGNVRIDVLHTPGHTPEHLCFIVTDTKGANRPLGIFTGDCVFVGDMGRPDLLETAAGVIGSAQVGAHGQWLNMLKFQAMPDYLQIYPGHGAGSACGKALGAIPTSTVGYEKMFNPAFQFTDESSFVRWMLSGQPETPHYFKHMKRINKIGAPLLADLPVPQPMEGFILGDVLKSDANLIDARPDMRDGSVIGGSLRIFPTNKFNTYAGWMVDYDLPTYLIVDMDGLPELLKSLRAVGVDQVEGYFPPAEVESAERLLPHTDVEGARALIVSGAALLDVRAASEYDDGHIADAVNIPYGLISANIAHLPRETPLIVYCQSGVRSAIATSLLVKLGFSNVVNLNGGFDAWQKANQSRSSMP
ncbi:MAG: MBL fold metallo-hydrolase [Anaerolineae bacterium]